jgi:SPP1 family predicted phage head-tail adaptor
MESGRLRHFVTIQTVTDVQDEDTGNITPTPSTFAEVWAAVEPLSAREFIAAAASQSKVTARIVIRYLAGIKPSMRIVHGDHTYLVEAILEDPKSGLEYITLPVSEVVSG